MSLRGSKATEAISSNSKFLVILGLDPRISIRNSRFICDEIHGSSGDDTRLRNSRLFVMRSKKNGCEAKIGILDWEF